jgi:DHA2 family multidrug resistance protein
MLSYTGLVLMPTLLHDLRGYPDTEIGYLIASRGVGNWIAFLFIAKLTRIAPRFAIGLGLALQAISGFWLASLGLDITEFDVIATNMLQGLGMSVSFTPIIVMSFSTLPKHHIAEGTGVFTMIRNFGSSLFVSMSVLVFVRSTSTKYAELAEYVTPYRMDLLYPAMPESWNPETVGGLARLSREVQRQAAMIGYINAFHMLGICAAMAVPLVLLLRRKPPPEPLAA